MSKAPIYRKRAGGLCLRLPAHHSGGGGTSQPISGTGPVSKPLADGDTLSTGVTWGAYSPAEAEVYRFQRLDDGSWASYTPGVAVSEGQEWAFREIVEHGDYTRTFTSTRVTVAAPPAPVLEVLTLSGNSIGAEAAQSAVIGSLSGKTSGSTLSLQSNGGGAFALSGSNLVVSGSLVAGTFTVVVRETLAGATGSPKDTSFTVTVNAAAPTLAVLTLSASAVLDNAAVGATVGTYSGKTSGSTVTLQNNASGRFSLDGTALKVAQALTPGSYNVTLRETLAGATNTPRDTTISITVTAALAISGMDLDDGTLSLNLSKAATVYYLVSSSGASMSGSAIKSGYAAAPVGGTWGFTPPGPMDHGIDLTSLADGDYFLHLAAESGSELIAAGPFGFTYTAPEEEEPPGPSTPLAIAQTDSRWDESGALTLASRNFGPESAGRRIVAMGLFDTSANPTLTIGGVAATKHLEHVGSGYKLIFFSAVVPTGTTGSIVATGVSYMYLCPCWAITGAANVLHDSKMGASGNGTAIAVKAGGAGLALRLRTTTTTPTIAWEGIDNAHTVFADSTSYYATASEAFAADNAALAFAGTFSGTTGGVDYGYMALSFGVAP